MLVRLNVTVEAALASLCTCSCIRIRAFASTVPKQKRKVFCSNTGHEAYPADDGGFRKAPTRSHTEPRHSIRGADSDTSTRALQLSAFTKGLAGDAPGAAALCRADYPAAPLEPGKVAQKAARGSLRSDLQLSPLLAAVLIPCPLPLHFLRPPILNRPRCARQFHNRTRRAGRRRPTERSLRRCRCRNRIPLPAALLVPASPALSEGTDAAYHTWTSMGERLIRFTSWRFEIVAFLRHCSGRHAFSDAKQLTLTDLRVNERRLNKLPQSGAQRRTVMQSHPPGEYAASHRDVPERPPLPGRNGNQPTQ